MTQSRRCSISRGLRTVRGDRARALPSGSYISIRNGTVYAGLAQAIWLIRNALSCEYAVARAVDSGQIADTVACVAGTVAGKLAGPQSISSRWTTYLNQMVTGPSGGGVYEHASLQALARSLLVQHEP